MNIADGLVRTLSALALVLGLMLGLAALAKRFLRGQGTDLSQGPSLRVLRTVYLGSRTSVSLVAAGGETLIVGTSPAGLVSLGRITDSGKAAPVAAQDGPAC